MKLSCFAGGLLWFTTAIQDGIVKRNASSTYIAGTFGFVFQCLLHLASLWTTGLQAADHMTMLLSSCSSLLYAMRVLRSHGTPNTSLHDIFRVIIVSHIQYAAPAWSGISSATDRARLDSLLRRGKWFGYCSNDVSTVTELFNSADDDFLNSSVVTVSETDTET